MGIFFKICSLFLLFVSLVKIDLGVLFVLIILEIVGRVVRFFLILLMILFVVLGSNCNMKLLVVLIVLFGLISIFILMEELICLDVVR